MMLLRQLHCELVDDIPRISLKSSIQGAVTVYHDEPERWLADQEFFLELVEIEFRVTVVDGEVDGFEWFKVTDEFFLSGRVFVHDATDEEYKAVVRCSLIEFEPFTSGILSFHDSESVGFVFDLRGLALLIQEELGDLGDNLFGRHDDRDYAPVDLGSLKSVE